MNHCPVSASIDRHLSELDRAEAREEAIDDRLEAMMEDADKIAAIVDDVLQNDAYTDVAGNGSSVLANALAECIRTDDPDARRDFFGALEKHVRNRMRLDAETEVAAEMAGPDDPEG